MTFDVLFSADALVPDHDQATARVHRELGIRPPPERHVVRSAEQRATWSFLRVHPDRSLAPTNLELLQAQPGPAGPLDPDYSFIPEIAAAQGDRPAKLHSTPVGVGDLDAIIDRLERTGGRYRLHEATPALPFRRLWIGYTDDGTGRYDPGTDGGLYLEFVPTEAHRLPAEPTPPPAPRHDGGLIRVLARTILVDDLAATLRAAEHHLGLEPDAVCTGADGVERATYRFTDPRSGSLEVLRPGPTAVGFEAELFRDWGPGACGIRFAVDGLDAFHARQVELGLDIAAVGDDGERLVRPVDPALGNAYEFVPWSGD